VYFYKSTTLLLQGKYAFDIIVLVLSTMFQTYDIISCDYSHMPFYYSKEKEKKIRSRKSK